MNKTKLDFFEEECPYIAFIDILGFSNYVLHTDPKEVAKIFDEIIAIREALGKDKIFHENVSIQNKYNDLSASTYMHIMSDSIVLAVPKDNDYSLLFLVMWAKRIQSVLLKKFLQCRGGISTGYFYANGEIIFGAGLVFAHNLEQKTKYAMIVVDSRIVIDKNTRNFLVPPTNDDELYYIDYLNDLELQSIRKISEHFKNEKPNNDKVLEKLDWIIKSLENAAEKKEEQEYNAITQEEYYESLQNKGE